MNQVWLPKLKQSVCNSISLRGYTKEMQKKKCITNKRSHENHHQHVLSEMLKHGHRASTSCLYSSGYLLAENKPAVT